jgi:glutamyl-tRNA reductase
LGSEAVRHVFRVAASLDSMVVGEPQILGQMKQAYRTATEEKTSGVVLNRLLHRTFFIAKRIRTETGIGDSAVSISYAAIELGRKIFGTLEGKQVLLIGAGEMAELAVEHLIRQRSGTIFVANRTFERGVALAEAYKGTAIRFEEIPDHLNKVDIIISSTGAAGYVLEKKDIKAVMRGRRNRPIFFIDIAVPRDIDPKINTLENTYVYDIDDLQGVIDDNIEERQREAVKAERIIDEAVIQFRQWFESLKVVPTIKSLREKVRSMAFVEVKKTMQQLPHLSKDDQKTIERLVDATINKILHHPTHYLKSNGCQGERPEALDIARKLFGLDD